MEGKGQQRQCGRRLGSEWGAELGLGRVRAQKQGSLKATRGLGSRRGLVSPCPNASRPRRPSAARLAPDPQLTEGRSEGAGLVLAQGSPIIHSSCEGELGIALESMQDKKELI